MAERGLVVMAYGSPAGPDEVQAYYTHIRRGRPPTPEQLADLQDRYQAIGGMSPLRERTEAQVAAIRAELESLEPGRWIVGLGMKHSAPFIEDSVTAVADAGVRDIVGLVLTPHYSAASVGTYLSRAGETAADRSVGFTGIESWHLEPSYIDFLERAASEALAGLPEKTKVFFTAHSLPKRVLADDPYPDALLASATAVADRLGLAQFSEWGVCYQSAGRTGDEWIGPDIDQVVADLGETGRSEGVLVCPQGFVSDHLEIRYDLDIDTRRVATEAGLAFARTDVVNDEPAVMQALAARVAATDPVDGAVP